LLPPRRSDRKIRGGELLRRLEAEQGQARTLLLRFESSWNHRGRHETTDSSTPPGQTPPAPQSPEEKVRALSPALPRGGDVVPDALREQEDRQAGIRRYLREQVRARRMRPAKVKCGECRTRLSSCRRAPSSEHLQEVATSWGVRTLRVTKPAWFLAVDFGQEHLDGRRSGVSLHPVPQVGLPAASSGHGRGTRSRYWSDSPTSPLPIARKMGCPPHHRDECPGATSSAMDSYDRLFPSQDTMIRSGFGNADRVTLQARTGSRELGVPLISAPAIGGRPAVAYLAGVRGSTAGQSKDRQRGDSRRFGDRRSGPAPPMTRTPNRRVRLRNATALSHHRSAFRRE